MKGYILKQTPSYFKLQSMPQMLDRYTGTQVAPKDLANYRL